MLSKLFVLMFASVLFFPVNDNIIEWSPTRKLTWSDFKGTPDPASTNAALTNSTIHVEFGFDNKGLKHSIKCRFNKQLSWGRIRNEYILNHEQGHFDIAEVHARMLHKNLNEYSFNSETVSKDIEVIYNDAMKLHVAMQKEYDLVTNHSLDSAQQNLWDKKISGLLQNLDKFSDYK